MSRAVKGVGFGGLGFGVWWALCSSSGAPLGAPRPRAQGLGRSRRMPHQPAGVCVRQTLLGCISLPHHPFAHALPPITLRLHAAHIAQPTCLTPRRHHVPPRVPFTLAPPPRPLQVCGGGEQCHGHGRHCVPGAAGGRCWLEAHSSPRFVCGNACPVVQPITQQRFVTCHAVPCLQGATPRVRSSVACTCAVHLHHAVAGPPTHATPPRPPPHPHPAPSEPICLAACLAA